MRWADWEGITGLETFLELLEEIMDFDEYSNNNSWAGLGMSWLNPWTKTHQFGKSVFCSYRVIQWRINTLTTPTDSTLTL